MKTLLSILLLFAIAIFATGKSNKKGRRCRKAVLAIERPANGKLFACCRFKRIKFVCNAGYKLVNGDQYLRCKKGRIYGTFPKCVLGHDQPCGLGGYSPSRGRIVGGKRSKPGDWPWMVAIYRNDRFICGGALISSSYVVTAAHCFYEWYGLVNDPDKYRLWFGRTRLDRDEDEQKQVATGSKIHIHPQFALRTFENDIAIVKLDTQIQFNKYVKPLCLPNKEDNKPGRLAYVAGWGATKKVDKYSRPGKFSKALKYVYLPIVDDKKCLESTPKGAYFNNATMLCAGDGKGRRDACFGDSGGPLVFNKKVTGADGKVFYKWSMVGIVSWGEGCALKKKYGYFARVFNYIDWMKPIVGLK